MNWLVKIGRWSSTIILGFLLVMTIVMVVFVTDTRATIMNADWVESEMDKGGFYTAIRSEFIDSINDSFTGDLGEAEVQNIRDAVDTAVTEDWIKANFEENMDLIYAYLKSESDNPSFSLTLPQNLKDSIKDNIEIVFGENPPEGLSPYLVEAGIDAIKQQVDYLPGEITLHILNMEELQPARDVIKICDYVFYILIALAFFLAVLLVFLHFTIKDAARILGVYSLIGGAISLTGVLVLKSIAPRIVGEGDLSGYITEDMIVMVIRDSMAPAYIFSIVLLVVAVLLIVASFFIKRKDETRSNYNHSV
jgi:hypothetical protein